MKDPDPEEGALLATGESLGGEGGGEAETGEEEGETEAEVEIVEWRPILATTGRGREEGGFVVIHGSEVEFVVGVKGDDEGGEGVAVVAILVGGAFLDEN
jgi:hypothetical protein